MYIDFLRGSWCRLRFRRGLRPRKRPSSSQSPSSSRSQTTTCKMALVLEDRGEAGGWRLEIVSRISLQTIQCHLLLVVKGIHRL